MRSLFELCGRAIFTSRKYSTETCDIPLKLKEKKKKKEKPSIGIMCYVLINEIVKNYNVRV